MFGRAFVGDIKTDSFLFRAVVGGRQGLFAEEIIIGGIDVVAERHHAIQTIVLFPKQLTFAVSDTDIGILSGVGCLK